jgi:L-rhamnose mutarotase
MRELNGIEKVCGFGYNQQKIGGYTNMEDVKRFGWVIGIRKERIAEYKELHANVWPGVLDMIKQCNIRNYSIYLGEVERDRYCLFSYLEYTGDDFEADMAIMAADETTKRWWDVCKPCQQPLETRAEGEWWMDMEEVFHCD